MPSERSASTGHEPCSERCSTEAMVLTSAQLQAQLAPGAVLHYAHIDSRGNISERRRFTSVADLLRWSQLRYAMARYRPRCVVPTRSPARRRGAGRPGARRRCGSRSPPSGDDPPGQGDPDGQLAAVAS